MAKRNIRNLLLITLIIGGSFLCSMIVYAEIEHDSASGPIPYQDTSTYDQNKATETNKQIEHDVASGPTPYQNTSTYDQNKASEANKQMEHDSAPGPTPYQDTSTYDQNKASQRN